MRIFSPEYRNYSQVATMSSLRWYPTVMTFPDGNMLILGGNQAVSSRCFACCTACANLHVLARSGSHRGC